ncbi:unnamed protein product, partial [Effrenium voratum]
ELKEKLKEPKVLSPAVGAPAPCGRRARPTSAKALKHRRVIDDSVDSIIYEDDEEEEEKLTDGGQNGHRCRARPSCDSSSSSSRSQSRGVYQYVKIAEADEALEPMCDMEAKHAGTLDMPIEIADGHVHILLEHVQVDDFDSFCEPRMSTPPPRPALSNAT